MFKSLTKHNIFKEYNILQTASLLYISIPTIIFLLGWLKPIYSIPLVLLTFVGLFYSIKAGWNFTFEKTTVIEKPKVVEQTIITANNKTKNNKQKPIVKQAIPTKNVQKSEPFWLIKLINNPLFFHLFAITLVIISVLHSGVGGFAIQDGDYVKHNGFFLDLTKYSWPLAYENTGADNAPRILNTYLAYYLPSAFLGKFFGFSFAYFFSFIWVCLGLYITLIWVSQFVSKRSVFYLLIFMFFGELAYFGWVKYFPNFSMYGKSFNYANWMVFHSMPSEILKGVFWILGSNHTFLSNGPHHIFPSWICILMVFHDAVFRKNINRIGFIFAFTPFVSAFMAIGLAPFVLLAAIQNKFKNTFTFQNIVVAPLLIIVAGLFLTSNNAQFEKGWIWDFVKMGDVSGYLFRFFLLGFGLYFLIMPKKKSNFHDPSMLPWLYTAVGCIILFSFYRIGLYMDFPIKAYNPSWIIFQVCVIASISYSKTFAEHVRSSFVILLVIIASVGAFSNFKYVSDNKLFKHTITEENSMHINKIGPKEQSVALFSDGNSFFWKVLAKKPIYTKN